MIRRCPDHDHFDDEACPDCGAAGEAVLDRDRRVRLSKFLSGALRHFPDDADVDLDDRGWTDFDSLVRAAADRYPWADREAVAAVVATDPKGRFERTGIEADDQGDGRIRAAYGHSVDVSLEPNDDPVPDRLYHGTDPASLDSIRRDGLKPMGRQQVHLSETIEEARAVGRRHAPDPVVLVVDAAGLQAAGRRISKRGEGTYTADRVPPEFLSRADAAGSGDK